MNESIVIYTTFTLQNGANDGASIVEPDEILWNGERWRITSINNWAEWGFTVGYAEKVRG